MHTAMGRYNIAVALYRSRICHDDISTLHYWRLAAASVGCGYRTNVRQPHRLVFSGVKPNERRQRPAPNPMSLRGSCGLPWKTRLTHSAPPRPLFSGFLDMNILVGTTLYDASVPVSKVTLSVPGLPCSFLCSQPPPKKKTSFFVFYRNGDVSCQVDPYSDQ